MYMLNSRNLISGDKSNRSQLFEVVCIKGMEAPQPPLFLLLILPEVL